MEATNVDPTVFTGTPYYFDKLVRTWFPNTNFSSQTRVQGLMLLDVAYRKEDPLEPYNDPKLKSRWPWEATDAGARSWCQRIIRLLDVRLVQFQSHTILERDLHALNKANVESSPPKSVSPRPHAVLNIPELLEKVLRVCDPGSLFNAGRVNSRFRDVVKHILSHQYRAQNSSAPVEYGDVFEMPSPQLNWYERIKFVSDVKFLRRSRERYGNHLFEYFPANFTQASNVPDHLAEAVRSLYSVQNGGYMVTEEKRFEDKPQWLDFSQFRFNHYLKSFFGPRMKINCGRWEIVLRPHPRPRGQLLQIPAFADASLMNLIRTMYATDPPCKSIGIYEPEECSWADGYRQQFSELPDEDHEVPALYFLCRVNNPNGITVGDLINGLLPFVHRIKRNWERTVEYHRDDLDNAIEEQDFLKYRSRRQKNRALQVGASPKFVLLVDNAAMDACTDGRGHVSRASCIAKAFSPVQNKMEWDDVWLRLRQSKGHYKPV